MRGPAPLPEKPAPPPPSLSLSTSELELPPSVILPLSASVGFEFNDKEPAGTFHACNAVLLPVMHAIILLQFVLLDVSNYLGVDANPM